MSEGWEVCNPSGWSLNPSLDSLSLGWRHIECLFFQSSEGSPQRNHEHEMKFFIRPLHRSNSKYQSHQQTS